MWPDNRMDHRQWFWMTNIQINSQINTNFSQHLNLKKLSFLTAHFFYHCQVCFRSYFGNIKLWMGRYIWDWPFLGAVVSPYISNAVNSAVIDQKYHRIFLASYITIPHKISKSLISNTTTIFRKVKHYILSQIKQSRRGDLRTSLINTIQQVMVKRYIGHWSQLEIGSQKPLIFQ